MAGLLQLACDHTSLLQPPWYLVVQKVFSLFFLERFISPGNQCVDPGCCILCPFRAAAVDHPCQNSPTDEVKSREVGSGARAAALERPRTLQSTQTPYFRHGMASWISSQLKRAEGEYSLRGYHLTDFFG